MQEHTINLKRTFLLGLFLFINNVFFTYFLYSVTVPLRLAIAAAFQGYYISNFFLVNLPILLILSITCFFGSFSTSKERGTWNSGFLTVLSATILAAIATEAASIAIIGTTIGIFSSALAQLAIGLAIGALAASIGKRYYIFPEEEGEDDILY